MLRNKSYINFICATLVCALLMVSMGRVSSVSAIGTTTAIASTAFILTGAVYLSYVALTQGEMILPAAEDLHNWLGSIGRKVSQYSSGAAAYKDIYQDLLRDPLANVIDGVWTWTQERIKSFANDFSDTRLIQNIISFERDLDIHTQVTNKFDYPFEISNVEYVRDGYSTTYYTIPQFLSFGYTASYGQPIVSVQPSNVVSYVYGWVYGDTQYRNVLKSNGYYGVQYFDGTRWIDTSRSIRFGIMFNNNLYSINYNDTYGSYYTIISQSNAPTTSLSYPLFLQADTYVESTGEIITADPVTETEIVRTPNWLDPDNDNRPIIPWVPIPQLPTNITPPSGFNGISQWGFNLDDLLDLLESLSESLISIDAIARLLNEFAGQHGDNYYIEYNNGDTNYYTYYQPTIFDDDTEYITYNIDVSEQQDIIPVDLNTISLYTNNDYLNAVKQSARNFGNTIGQWFVFWHNTDPLTLYVIFGSFIVVLIGAFIGKWGHS